MRGGESCLRARLQRRGDRQNTRPDALGKAGQRLIERELLAAGRQQDIPIRLLQKADGVLRAFDKHRVPGNGGRAAQQPPVRRPGLLTGARDASCDGRCIRMRRVDHEVKALARQHGNDLIDRELFCRDRQMLRLRKERLAVVRRDTDRRFARQRAQKLGELSALGRAAEHTEFIHRGILAA